MPYLTGRDENDCRMLIPCMSSNSTGDQLFLHSSVRFKLSELVLKCEQASRLTMREDSNEELVGALFSEACRHSRTAVEEDELQLGRIVR